MPKRKRLIDQESGDEPLPDQMLNFDPSDLPQGIGPSDVTWPGANSELSDDQIEKLEKWLADPDRSLRQLLRALVRAHSDREVDRRLHEAYSAVTGEPKAKGNRTKDDDPVLLEMGRLYFLRSFGFEEGNIDIGGIAFEAVQVVGVGAGAGNSEEALKKRLVRKFGKDIDQWCYAAAEQHGQAVHVQRRTLRDALEAIERLGIPVKTKDHKPTN